MKMIGMDPVEALLEMGRQARQRSFRVACLKHRRKMLSEEREAFSQGGIKAVIELKEKRRLVSHTVGTKSLA